MTLLFIAIATSVLVGTVFLWLSGYFTGQAVGSQIIATLPDPNSLERKIEAQQQQIGQLTSELKKQKNKVAVTAQPVLPTSNPREDEDHLAEVARLNSSVTRAEGERDKAQFERDTLQEELDYLEQQMAQNKPPEKPTTLPKPAKRSTAESDVFDELHAYLDLEKVKNKDLENDVKIANTALEKAKTELTNLKKVAALNVASATTSDAPTTGASRRTKTQVMATRSPFSKETDMEKIRIALEKAQAQNDKLESELQRAKKENQLLAMRK